MIIHEYDLDMVPNKGRIVSVWVNQYDEDFILKFNLFASSGEFTVQSGTTAAIRGTKPDGNGYSADASLNENVVTVTGDQQMTAVAGKSIFELTLYKNDKELSTANFILNVEKAALDSDTIQSESVLRELDAIIEGAETATQAAEDATDAADRAEEAARTLTIDDTLTQTGQAADAKKTGDEIDDLKGAIELKDFTKSVIVGSKTNARGSFRWYGPNGTSDVTGTVGIMREIPVSQLLTQRLPSTEGSYHLFIFMSSEYQIDQPEDQYLPFTASVELDFSQELENRVMFGFTTHPAFNPAATLMDLTEIAAGSTGSIVSQTGKYQLTKDTEEKFKWVYINGSRADLAKIRTISFVLDNPILGKVIGDISSTIAGIQNTVGTVQTDVTELQDSIEAMQLNTINLNEQLTDSIVFAGSDREYINGSLTGYHSVGNRRKCQVSSVIPQSATETAAAFFHIAQNYCVDAVNGNYYPFTVFLHVRGGEQLSGNGVWLYYSTSGSAFVPNHANIISAKYIGKTSGYCSVNNVLNKTYDGSMTLQYICVQGLADDLRKIEYIQVILNDFAASLNNTALESQISEMDARLDVVESEIGMALNDYSLIAYGDSLTQGAGASSTNKTYINQCKIALGAKNCIRYGYGGSASAPIAFTAGALSGYIPPNVREFSLKYADLSTDIAIALNQLNDKVVVIDGEEYTISQNGNTAYSLPSTYTPSNKWLPVKLKNAYNKADIYIIWIGTNDGNYVWDIIDAMIAKCEHKQYIVMGMTRLGTDTTVENEQTAYRKYGSHFFNTRVQMINNAFAVLGMTPEPEDTTAINNGLMPPNLLTDNVHFNDAGYEAIGKLLAMHIKSLGYSYQKAE